MTYDPRTIKVGDWLVIKPDYDKRKGRHSVQVMSDFRMARNGNRRLMRLGLS